jgi:hypothetical protein
VPLFPMPSMRLCILTLTRESAASRNQVDGHHYDHHAPTNNCIQLGSGTANITGTHSYAFLTQKNRHKIVQIVSIQSLHYLTLSLLVPPLLSIFAQSTSLNYEGGAAYVGEGVFPLFPTRR